MMKHILTFFLFLFSVNLGFSNIRYVADYSSIQETIDYSLPADTVILDTCVYHEYINISQHGLTLASIYLLQQDTTIIQSTILSGNYPDEDERSLVIVDGPFQDSLIIQGITFENGNRLPEGVIACLDIKNVNVRLTKNVFQNFHAYEMGAIWIDSSNVIANNNIICNNHAVVHNAGILCTNSIFHFNNNIFNNNYVDFGEGGGITISDSRGIIHSNIFQQNNASSYGSGIFLYPSEKVMIENNSFTNNEGSAGCGVFSFECDTLFLCNNDFSENHAIAGPQWRGNGAAVHIWSVPEQIVEISWNIFNSNLADNHSALVLGCYANFHHNKFINNIGRVSSAVLTEIHNQEEPQSFGWKNLFINNRPIQGSEDDYDGAIAAGPSTTLSIHQSDFINNEYLAATSTPGGQYLSNNFWGDPSGPNSQTQNPNGQGDSLGGWLNPHPYSVEHFWNPNIDITDSLLSFDTLSVDSNVERSFFIYNKGVLTLVIDAIAPDLPEFTVQQIGDSSIHEDDSLEVTIFFNSDSPGVFEGSLFIFSNDTTEAMFALPLLAVCEGSPVYRQNDNHTPEHYFITEAFPNPFNNSSTVKVNLPHRSNLELILYNIQGQVETIINEKTLNRGLHSFVINSNNLPSGTYFLQASVEGGLNEVRKLVLVK